MSPDFFSAPRFQLNFVSEWKTSPKRKPATRADGRIEENMKAKEVTVLSKKKKIWNKLKHALTYEVS